MSDLQVHGTAEHTIPVHHTNVITCDVFHAKVGKKKLVLMETWSVDRPLFIKKITLL